VSKLDDEDGVRDLGSHDLVEEAMGVIIPALGRVHTETVACSGLGWVMPDDLSPAEQYGYAVFSNGSAGPACIDCLLHACSFIESPPTEAVLRSYGIRRDRWLDYHVAVFHVSMVSMSDLAMVLTNVVLRLGLDDRCCRKDTVHRNAWVRDSAVGDALAPNVF